jgi:hypothetical protein
MNPIFARLAAVVVLASGISWQTALADTMTGSIVFTGSPLANGYDPGNGLTLAGFSNDTQNSPTVTLAGGTSASFGYQDLVVTDTAVFTAGQLVIESSPSGLGFGTGSTGWTQTFTASKTGFFAGWTLFSSDFPPTFTSSLDPTNTTLTVTWTGTVTDGTFDATFTASSTPAVPGPIVGAGLPGLALAFGGILAWRCRKRKMARSSH